MPVTIARWDVSPAFLVSWVKGHPVSSLILIFFTAVICPILYVIISQLAEGCTRYIQLHFLQTDEFQHIPRPKSKFGPWTLISGDFGQDAKAPMFARERGWMEATGSSVICPRGLLYRPALLIIDPVAMHHVLTTHCYKYRKPTWARDIVLKVVGPGVAAVEGQVHKHQRRIVQPAFSIMAVRGFVPLFFSHAKRLTARLEHMIDHTDGPAEESFWPGQTSLGAQHSAYRKPIIDVAYWLSRTTLDIVAHAGFGEQFNTIEHKEGDESHALATHFKRMLYATSGISMSQFLVTFVARKLGLSSFANRLYPDQVAMKESRKKTNDLCSKIVERKKTEIREEQQIAPGGKEVKKSDWIGDSDRPIDLLHRLMRANMSIDLKESERLKDEEILAQMATFLFAGHETTSANISHVLYQLARNQDLQDRLRAELNDRLAGRDELNYDELNSMPLLDATIKEALRIMPPLAVTVRVANEDDVLPLSKNFACHDGKGTFNKIVIKAGTQIPILIHMSNTSKDLWGDDAEEFIPERWFNIPEAVKSAEMPMHMMSFIAGPRGCLGQRFSIIEAKTLLSTLIPVFKFEAIEGWIAEPHAALVTQSFIKGQAQYGHQQPLLVSRI